MSHKINTLFLLLFLTPLLLIQAQVLHEVDGESRVTGDYIELVKPSNPSHTLRLSSSGAALDINATTDLYLNGQNHILLGANNPSTLVGIGTAAPSAQLEIVGGAGPLLKINPTVNNWNLATGDGDFRIGNDDYHLEMSISTDGNGAGIARIQNDGMGNSGSLILGSNDSDVLFIRNDKVSIVPNGNVGIGTNSPNYKLHIEGSTTSSGSTLRVETNYTGSNGSTAIYGASSFGSGTKRGVNGIATGDGILFGIRGYASGNAFTSGDAYGVYGLADSGAGSKYGVYGLANHNSGTKYGVYGEASGSGTNYAGYFDGDVFTTGSYLPSDKKLKTHINPAASSLERMQKLKVKTYHYDTKLNEVINLDNRIQTGFLAQDVENLFPELIKEIKHPTLKPEEIEQGKEQKFLTFKGINYVGFIPHLVHAAQEQQTQIEALKATNQQLQAINQTLIQRVERLEALLATTERQEVENTIVLTSARLEQNAPNPFTEKTTIRYFIPKNTKQAELQIANQEGKLLKTIPINNRGEGQTNIAAQSLSADIYYYTLLLDGKIYETKKMVLTGRD